MKNIESWKPSKFVYRRGKLMASRDVREVGVSSRLITDLVAKFYDLSLKDYAKGHLLDLGCGQVPLYEAYKDYVEEVTCVDWENSAHKNIYLDKFADLNQVLPLKENQFDTIILSDVLEHIKEPKLLWREMNRVLAEDGVLLMNVPFFYWLHEEPYDYYRYTKHALRAMAEESGFKVLNIKPLGGVPSILTDILCKNILRIPVLGKGLAIILQKATLLFISTKFGAKVSRVTAEKFPLGYSLIAKKQPL